MNKEKIVKFLEEMSAQDNRGTAFPYYYTIAEDEQKYREDDYGSFVQSFGEDICKISELIKNTDIEFEETDDVDAFLNEKYSDGYCRYSENGFDTTYTGVFLTEKDANEFLANSQNHFFEGNARTYVKHMSAWGRQTQTMDFFKTLFEYFEIPLPPERYYQKKGKEEQG